MNIVVKTACGHVICRPDTSWERKSEDLYLPDFVGSLSFTPVTYARISKPGRSIGEAFTSRYYSDIGCGILLYPDNFLDGSEEGFAAASCMDYSSLLPEKMLGKNDPSVRELNFSLKKGSMDICSLHISPVPVLNTAIQEASRIIYLRAGDFIAVELQNRMPLYSRNEGNANIRGGYPDMGLLDFDIIVE